MAKKSTKKAAPKKRAPQDLTQYALRGLRRRISDLEARVTRLERLEIDRKAETEQPRSADLDQQ